MAIALPTLAGCKRADAATVQITTVLVASIGWPSQMMPISGRSAMQLPETRSSSMRIAASGGSSPSLISPILNPARPHLQEHHSLRYRIRRSPRPIRIPSRSEDDVPAGPITPRLHLAARQLELQKCQELLSRRRKDDYAAYFTSDVPIAANEKIHIDLYDLYHKETPNSQPQEVVIRKFIFIPASASR